MIIATWNVPALYRVGAMNKLVKEMDKYKKYIYMYMLYKKLDGQGKNCDKKNYMIFM